MCLFLKSFLSYVSGTYKRHEHVSNNYIYIFLKDVLITCKFLYWNKGANNFRQIWHKHTKATS